MRPGRLAAFLVDWGDILVTAPSDGGKSIGTVLAARTESGSRIFKIRKADGTVTETKPVANEKPVWVHVPKGTA